MRLETDFSCSTFSYTWLAEQGPQEEAAQTVFSVSALGTHPTLTNNCMSRPPEAVGHEPVATTICPPSAARDRYRAHTRTSPKSWLIVQRLSLSLDSCLLCIICSAPLRASRKLHFHPHLGGENTVSTLRWESGVLCGIWTGWWKASRPPQGSEIMTLVFPKMLDRICNI